MSEEEEINSNHYEEGFFYHEIADQLCKNYTEKHPFRRPMDAPAYRLANEFVIQFLLRHRMEISEKIANEESNSYLMERHSPTWIARRLKIDGTDSLFPQLVRVLGKAVNYQKPPSHHSNEGDLPEVQQRALPKVPSEIRSQDEQQQDQKEQKKEKPSRKREEDDDRKNLQSSDSGVFTEMLNGTTTTAVQEPSEQTRHRHRHHHGQRPYFTALENPTQYEEKDKMARLYTKKKKAKEPEPPKDFRQAPPLSVSTHIDTN